MAMNKFIKIEKLDPETEKWNKYYEGYAEVNKATGKEYFNAKFYETYGETPSSFRKRYRNI